MEERGKIKASGSLTEDAKHFVVHDDSTDELVTRLSFYAEGLTPEERKIIGEAAIKSYVEIMALKEEGINKDDWYYKAQAFREAYNIQEIKEESHIIWLMINILGIEEKEARRRYRKGRELLDHPDFKGKITVVVDKIYLSKDHLV